MKPEWAFDERGRRLRPDGTPGCDCWLWNERGGGTRQGCPVCGGEDIYGTEQRPSLEDTERRFAREFARQKTRGL